MSHSRRFRVARLPDLIVVSGLWSPQSCVTPPVPVCRVKRRRAEVVCGPGESPSRGELLHARHSHNVSSLQCLSKREGIHLTLLIGTAATPCQWEFYAAGVETPNTDRERATRTIKTKFNCCKDAYAGTRRNNMLSGK